MKKIISPILTFLIAISVTTSAVAQSTKKTVAIFVRNDSAKYTKLLDANKKNLENILSSHVNNSGFGIISPDLVLRNVNAYLNNDNAKYRNVAENIRSSVSTDKKLDMQLFENASGLRLAEMIGADYILTVSISSVSEQKKASTLYGVNTTNYIYTLRCNYNLCEGGMGIGTSGKSVKSQKMIRSTDEMIVEKNEEFFYELLEDCASQMAETISQDLNQNKIIAKVDAKTDVIFEVKVTALRFPQVFQENDGSYAIKKSLVPLELMTINAEIDGVSYTTNTGYIKLAKGIHYIKIHHKDLEPIERSINVTGVTGQKFSYEGILTEEAKQRLKADMEWMQKTVEKYKDSIVRDKVREIELERKRIQAKSEADDVEIKVKKAEVKIADMQSDIDIKKNVTAAKIREIDAYARSKVIMSKAELEKAKGIYEALKQSGFKINANVNID